LEDRQAAGGRIGVARRLLSAARARAVVLGAAVAGRAVAPDKSAAWTKPDGTAMTEAGRKLVQRQRRATAQVLRDLRKGKRSAEARKIAKALRRARLAFSINSAAAWAARMHAGGTVAGDEVAGFQTVSPYSARGLSSALPC
jgi:uncharacterized membrane protein